MLPITVITAISLFTLFIAPQNFTICITLAVITLLSVTTFHLSILSGTPTTGYLTFTNKIMIGVYAVFLYNLASSVYILRLVDAKKPEVASKIRSAAIKFFAVHDSRNSSSSNCTLTKFSFLWSNTFSFRSIRTFCGSFTLMVITFICSG